jgi:hypothetical protein
MQIVMCFTEGDGCTYSADHTYPFEYESAEAALVEFERLFKYHRRPGNGGIFTFVGMEFHCDTFHSGIDVYLPAFYTITEWFDTQRIDQ